MSNAIRSDAINSQEMLLIFIRWADGTVSVDEFVKGDRELRMSYEDVQHRVDSIVTDNRSVVAVKRLDMEANHIEDISEKFDIRTMAEIKACHRAIIESIHDAPVVYNAVQHAIGTMNARQQGLVHGAVLR